MGFVKTLKEVKTLRRETGEFYDAEMLAIMWETRPEIVSRLVPSPLKSAKRPLATAFLAHYPRTNFGPAYYEGALFIRASFNGVEGRYCLTMR